MQRCNAIRHKNVATQKPIKYRGIKGMKACQCYGKLWELMGLMVANDGILSLGEPKTHVCKTLHKMFSRVQIIVRLSSH
jgi:hypothetical protein